MKKAILFPLVLSLAVVFFLFQNCGQLGNTGAPVNLSTSSEGTFFINAGGAGYVSSSGVTWSQDSYFSGGVTFSNTNTVTGTSDPTLYNSERYGYTNSTPANFSYNFPVPNGSYNVTLMFAETILTAPALREFNVLINGNQVLTNFDIFATAGGQNIAVVKTFPTSVTTGQILILFTPGPIQNPKVNAIAIVPY